MPIYSSLPQDANRHAGFTTPLRLLLATTAALWMGAAQPQLASTPSSRHATDLRFRQAFTPQGQNGDLEISSMLRQADGQTVRLIGHMIKNETPVPGQFLLAPHQGVTRAVMVKLDPSQQDWTVPHVPGLVRISGLLQVNPQDGPDGISALIHLLPGPEALRSANAFELSGYVHRLQVARTTNPGRRHQSEPWSPGPQRADAQA